MIVRSNTTSLSDFTDLARFKLKFSLGDFNTTKSSNDASTKASLLDTYSVYFNAQSYQVTVAVLGFIGAIGIWMFVVSVIGCMYRHAFEERVDPEARRARQELREVRKLMDEEDEEIRKKIHSKDHNTTK